MSSDSCDTSAELSDEQVLRALKAVGKGMKPSLATTFLSRQSKSLTSLITKIISAAVHHLEESAFTEDGLNILEEMRSKTEFAEALLASLDNIEQTLMTRHHWEKIPQILASIYHRWSTVEGVQAIIVDILVKWVGVDVKKDDGNVNHFNCKTWENFCDDKELKFRQVDCAESLLTVIGQNLFENNPDSFEALYNEIQSHLLKEDCDVRDKLLRMLISMTLISGGMFEHRNISKKQTAPKIQHESGTNSEGPSITAREVVDKYLSERNAIQNDEFIYETIKHDETDDEESGRLHSGTTAENNPLIEDICETEFDNASQTSNRIDLVSPSHFETVECESTQFTIAKTENEIVQKEEKPHRIEKTVTVNRFNLKQNQVAMESSPSDYSSDEDCVEITHYVPEKSGRKENFRRNANNFMSNHGELNQTDEVKNPKFAEARAEEIFQHGRCDKLGRKALSLEKKRESFDSNSEVTMDMAKLKLKSDQQQVGNALKYQQTTSGGTQASQQSSSCEALGYLVQVVTETAVARELMYRNNYPVTDGAIIGRTSQCDVVVSCKTVSRTQARIYREGEQVFFETTSKTNASLVNNIPVHCHSGPIRINNGYTIQVGEVLFVWEEVGRCFEHQNDEGKSRIDKGDISGLKDTNACIRQSDQDVKAGASPVPAISDYKHIPRAEDVVHLAQKANLGAAGRDKESKLGRASRGRKTVAARLEADVKRCWKQSADGTIGQDTGDDTTADKNSTKANRCDTTVSNAIPNTIIDASKFHNAFSNEDLHDNHNESLNTSLPHAHNISFENKFLNLYQHKRKALKIPRRVPDVNICRDGGRKSARIRSGRRQCVVNAVPSGRRGTDRQLMIISRHYVEKDQVFSAQ